MQDLSGIGKSTNINTESTPKACSMLAHSSAKMGSICDQTTCPGYGKWWCPLTIW